MTLGTNPSLYQIADEFSLARSTPFPSGFYGKGGAPASGPLSFADFNGRSAVTTLTAVVTPSVTGTAVNASGTTNAATATPNGGTAPYTYSWYYDDGDVMQINSPSGQSTTFTAAALLNSGDSKTGLFRCTVKDSSTPQQTALTPQVSATVTRI